MGKHYRHNDVRTLKLSRFSQIALTETPYHIPGDFSLDKYFGKAWRMMPCAQTYRVELWFDATVAETEPDTWWHDTQEIEEHDDGSITFRCEVDGLKEIVWWILGYGPHCRVVSPPALVAQVVGLLERSARNYQVSG